MQASNHRWIQKSEYQKRLGIAIGIVALLSLAISICLFLIPVRSDRFLFSPIGSYWSTEVRLHGINVYGETRTGSGIRTSQYATVTKVVDSVLLPENVSFTSGSGMGGTSSDATQVLGLMSRLSQITHSQMGASLKQPAPDLSLKDELKALESSLVHRKDISGRRQIIYLPDALYWPYSDPPPDTTIVCGVIIQGVYGWSFVLNSVTPDEPRVRAAVVETFQRYLFIAGKGEVWQPFQSVFIKGQRYSKVWGGKYAAGM